MKENLIQWLERLGLADSERAYLLIVIGLIAVTSLVIHVVLHRVVLKFLDRIPRSERGIWHRAFLGQNLLTHMALALQGVVVQELAQHPKRRRPAHQARDSYRRHQRAVCHRRGPGPSPAGEAVVRLH